MATTKKSSKRRGRVDVKKMRKKHAESARGGDMITVESGETLFLIHPPCREGDEHEPTAGLPYIPVEVHYGVGGKGHSDGAMVVSLDKEVNPIIRHPFVRVQLKKRKVRILKGGCPMAKWLADEAPEDRVDREARETKYVWGATPIRYRSKKDDDWRDLSPKPGILFCGPMIHDGIMEAFDELEDITDYDGAVLISINRRGQKMQTKYRVKADNRTIRRPLKVPSKLVKELEKMMAVGGDCDLFRFVANMIKGTKDVEALIAGVKLDDDDDEDEDDPPPKKRRRSRDDDDEPEDDEDEPEDDEDEPEDDEDEDEPEDDEDEDEPEDDEDEPEDDEDEDEPEDDEDEDEEDEPEDEDPDTADAEDDGEGDGDDQTLDDLDRDLQALSDKNKKAAKAKAAKKAGKKTAKKGAAKKAGKKAGKGK